MNKDLYNNKFSVNAETAVVWRSYKKSDRPVSTLNGFSKIYEQYLRNSVSGFFDKILSNFVAASW